MTSTNHSDAIEKLMQLGDCREFKTWPDYLALGLTEADIPELIRIATDRDLLWADGDDARFWAPIHAWRALGYLHAEAAIEPLIGLFDVGDDMDELHDWIDESITKALALIGPAAVPPLAAYLRDDQRSMWARTHALNCLEKIGVRHRAAQAACVAAIAGQLEHFRTEDPEFNAFMVSSLIDLDASDALPLIERAYKSGAVDEMVCGDFQEVRQEFGLAPASGIFDAL